MWGKRFQLDRFEQVISARIVIGVTGHRELEKQPALTEAIRSVVQSIKQVVPPMRSTPVGLCVLSPLAEGADRLVVREILKIPESTLEVVLPMEKDDYMQDFETSESKKEFERLLSQVRSIRTLTAKAERTEAYEQVGRYVVDQCDVLIALWNGKPATGQGGTAEMVKYARDTKCPLIWIHTDKPGQVTLEPGRGLNPGPLRSLDEYNSEQVNATNFANQLEEMRQFFVGISESAKLPSDRLQATLEYCLRHYVRADILALRYQHLYYRADSVVYVLALAAVVIAASQILFLPQRPIILTSEVLLMLAVLAIVSISRWRRWHDKWLDYRFLAERFRSALFMALANIDVSTLRPPRHLSLAYSPKDWMVPAFLSFWGRRPRLEMNLSTFQRLKCFICEAWIEEQISYHDGTRKRHYRRHHRMAIASYVLFGLTICAVLLHISNLGPDLLGIFFAFMAIVLPAIAATITAIRMHRDYLRNSMRSAEMVRHLTELKDRMMLSQDYNSFLESLKEAEETMLHENEDWRVVVRFHTPEPV
ncbi:MAG: hypothetical protein FJ023_07360 [Chloroflexi bacterium]|nr:hypothetical protein [Chloroflexota bacterium]